jgi:hypothetical protein
MRIDLQTAVTTTLAAALSLAPAPASASPANDGSVLLRMCKGADKVKALSVMCHSYLNGYNDAARHFGKSGYCLEDRKSVV